MNTAGSNHAARPGTIEALVGRDRWIAGTGLVLIFALAWWYVLAGAGTGMNTLAMTSAQFPPPVGLSPSHQPWPASYWLVMLLMWWVMMIAMMVPSAAPTILLHARVLRQIQQTAAQQTPAQPGSLGTTAVFVAGYLFCWLVFSLAATVLHWALERAGLVHGMMMWSTSTVLSASFLIAAGIYQLTPLKQACLSHCRSPLHFLTHNFQATRAGAFRMGIKHGAFCVGCCWILMALLFVGGVMNLLWIAGLGGYVLIERLFRFGQWLSRAVGLCLMALGGYVLLV